VHYTTGCNTQSSTPEDGQNKCPKHVELIEIISEQLLLDLYYLNFGKLVNVIACHSCTVSCAGNFYCKSHVITFVPRTHFTGLWFL